MAIAFESISADYAVDVADTSITPAVPTGTADGDLLIAVAACTTTINVSAPDGWQSLVSYNTGYRINIWWKIASSESGTYTFTASGTYSRAHVVVCRISGASSSAPTTPTPIGDTTWDASIACPDADVTVANSMILWAGAVDYTSSATLTSNRGTERYDVEFSVAATIAIYSEAVAATGTATGAALTLSGGTAGKVGATVLIAPAAAAGHPTSKRFGGVPFATVSQGVW